MNEKSAISDTIDRLEKLGSALGQLVRRHPQAFGALFLWFAALFVRIWLILDGITSAHPDEFYQSMEIAHKIVFGYGYISPEFSEEYPSIPSYAKSRSYLFPYFFVPIFWLGKTFGWDYHDVVLPLNRAAFVVVVSTVVPLTYVLVKRLSGNRNWGLAAAGVVAFDIELTHLGVHTFINSFVTPFILASLVAYLGVSGVKKGAVARVGKGDDNNDATTVATGNTEEESSPASSQTEAWSWTSDYSGAAYLVTAGFVLGVMSYIRVDSLAFIGLFFLFEFSLKKMRKLLMTALGGITGIVFGGLVDLVTWGEFFISPVQWYTFNIKEKHSEMFGTEPFDFYQQHLLFDNTWLVLGVALVFVTLWRDAFLVMNADRVSNSKSMKNIDQKHAEIGCRVRLLVMMVLLYYPYGTAKHKEIRFVHNWIWTIAVIAVIGYFSFAEQLSDLVHVGIKYFHGRVQSNIDTSHSQATTSDSSSDTVGDTGRKRRERRVRRAKQATERSVTMFLWHRRSRLSAAAKAIFLIWTLHSMITVNQTIVAEKDWELFDDLSGALIYVGNQVDVTGVIVTSVWYTTGMYVLLHRNVTIRYIDSDLPSFGGFVFLQDSMYNWLIVIQFKCVGNNADFLEEDAADLGYEEVHVIRGVTILKKT